MNQQTNTGWPLPAPLPCSWPESSGTAAWQCHRVCCRTSVPTSRHRLAVSTAASSAAPQAAVGDPWLLEHPSGQRRGSVPLQKRSPAALGTCTAPAPAPAERPGHISHIPCSRKAAIEKGWLLSDAAGVCALPPGRGHALYAVLCFWRPLLVPGPTKLLWGVSLDLQEYIESGEVDCLPSSRNARACWASCGLYCQMEGLLIVNKRQQLLVSDPRTAGRRKLTHSGGLLGCTQRSTFQRNQLTGRALAGTVSFLLHDLEAMAMREGHSIYHGRAGKSHKVVSWPARKRLVSRPRRLRLH